MWVQQADHCMALVDQSKHHLIQNISDDLEILQPVSCGPDEENKTKLVLPETNRPVQQEETRPSLPIPENQILEG